MNRITLESKVWRMDGRHLGPLIPLYDLWGFDGLLVGLLMVGVRCTWCGIEGIWRCVNSCQALNSGVSPFGSPPLFGSVVLGGAWLVSVCRWLCGSHGLHWSVQMTVLSADLAGGSLGHGLNPCCCVLLSTVPCYCWYSGLLLR